MLFYWCNKSLGQYHPVLITVVLLSFKIRKCEASGFFLLFQCCFGYLESLETPCEFI
jgi:hypothetical protein